MTEQGAAMSDRLFPKFHITQVATGQPVTDGFVLVPASDPHARVALQAYADSVRTEQPGLASDLDQWVVATRTDTAPR